MAPNGSSVLGKLTVPQLKALCKERRITGYSKLSKAALLQKLAEVAVPTTTTPQAANQSATVAPSITAGDQVRNLTNSSACIEASNACREGNVATVQSVTAGNTAPTVAATAKAPLPIKLPPPSQNRTTPSTQKASGTKRPAHRDNSAPPKRTKTSAVTNATHESSVARTPAFQQNLRVDSTPANARATGVSSITPVNEAQNLMNPSAYLGSSTASPEENVVRQPVQSATTANTESTEGSIAKAPLPPKLSQNRVATSFPRTQKASNTKRPAHTETSAPPKRIGTPTTTNTNHESSVPRTSTLEQRLPSVFKVPEFPTKHKGTSPHAVSTLVKRPPSTNKSADARKITGGPGRFKPLVMLKPNAGQANQRAIDSPLVSNCHPTSHPVLSYISLPPRASEQKWAHQWAIILSAISSTDRQTCMLVSRTFRYAVYLSAIRILSRNYSGRRLDAVLEQHPRNMTNFWPYLRFRMDEVSERRHAFKRSFLGRYTHSIGYGPLTDHLWTSPDDEKQVDVALRFVLTRMWFATSIGAYGHDASTWSKCVIKDVQEIVKGEIWQVVTQDVGTGQSCSFYVLEATCEVIGQPPSSQDKDTLGYYLRADWSSWISQRSPAPRDLELCSLLERVKWANTEDYHRGISKAWLCRVQGQDGDSIAKRGVAERYILASVVANGISGQWMSTSAMAQEFAGLPSNDALGSRTAGRTMNTVNMYLPAHHHIESIHFATSKDEALHGDVAVVQTPGREYYVLRENGMQVGCEEEGIPDVWQQILGCDALGRVR